MSTFITTTDMGDRVHIDGDKSITARTIGYCFSGGRMTVEVAWFNAGSHHTAWVDEWRLERCPT